MSTTVNEVKITTSQILDRKAIAFFQERGLVSMKRSGDGICIKCIPMTEKEEKDLQSVKDEFKRQDKS